MQTSKILRQDIEKFKDDVNEILKGVSSGKKSSVSSGYISPHSSSYKSYSAKKGNGFFEFMSSIDDDVMQNKIENDITRSFRNGACVAFAVNEKYGKVIGLPNLRTKNLNSHLNATEAKELTDMQNSSAIIVCHIILNYLEQNIPSTENSVYVSDKISDFFNENQDESSVLENMANAFVEYISQYDTLSEHELLDKTYSYILTLREYINLARQNNSFLAQFESNSYKVEDTDFVVHGFDVSGKSKSNSIMVAPFPFENVVGNAIAKSQAERMSKVLMAYDLKEQKNPFVELGGISQLLVIGTGLPGSGKTSLYKAIAHKVGEYCEMANYPFYTNNFTPDNISEYQGKSAQNMNEFVSNAINRKHIAVALLDDIDMFTASRGDSKASTGAIEVTSVLMQTFAGAATESLLVGNCAFLAFSNNPENLDPALIQRFSTRWDMPGPETLEDYTDLFKILIGNNHDIELGDYEFLATQLMAKEKERVYKEHDEPKEEQLLSVWEKHFAAGNKFVTIEDMGKYLFEIKKVHPRFTGRSIKNITDACKMRSMDFEIPKEWFDSPENFMHKPYATKIDMIKENMQKITPEMIMQEINRFADSDFSYNNTARERRIETIIEDNEIMSEAANRMGKYAKSN